MNSTENKPVITVNSLNEYKLTEEFDNHVVADSCSRCTLKTALIIFICLIFAASATFIGVELKRNEGPRKEFTKVTANNEINKVTIDIAKDGNTINTYGIPSYNQTKRNYNYTSKALLYTAFILIVLTLSAGTFLLLFKIVRHEEEERQSLLKVKIELLKEAQTSYIAELKKIIETDREIEKERREKEDNK